MGIKVRPLRRFFQYLGDAVGAAAIFALGILLIWLAGALGGGVL